MFWILRVDLFTPTKVYKHSRKTRNLLKRKIINQKLQIQTDLEFIQNERNKFNEKYSIDTFQSFTKGGYAFAVEQKIRELEN